MDFISKIFDLDLAKFVPEMPVFLGVLRALLVIITLLGPILLLALGLMYLLRPAPEANFKYGFRTYYGMGSTEAWKFAQKLAGLAFGGLGVILLLNMFIVVLTFFKKDLFQIANNAIVCLIWQAVLALIARIFVGVMCYIYFDKDGGHKKDPPKIPDVSQIIPAKRHKPKHHSPNRPKYRR